MNQDKHCCPFCGEGFPETQDTAWELYGLLASMAEDDGGRLGIEAFDLLSRLDREKRGERPAA